MESSHLIHRHHHGGMIQETGKSLPESRDKRGLWEERNLVQKQIIILLYRSAHFTLERLFVNDDV